MPESLAQIVTRISRRDAGRAEATLQADIRSLILAAGLNLAGDDLLDVNAVSLEAQVGDGTRRRIDIETGLTVIEVKRSLASAAALADGRKQLGTYVHQRVHQTGARYLGILTDGRAWHLYVPDPESEQELIEAGKALTVRDSGDTEKLIEWLGTILATVEQVRPTAEQIERSLGSGSPAYAADHATLSALYAHGKDESELRLKHRLWVKLLKTAFGSAFEDDESLFIDHTLLVITAEIIAHAVVGFDVSKTGSLTAQQLVDGSRFAQAQTFGVVESDFFDWPTVLPGGSDFVRSLAHRLSRFDWTHVDHDHDVLKHLYESVISPAARKSLGEYYTPDWLAQQMVENAVTSPASERVLDPSCGSGTFIFHAVRKHLAAREAGGDTPGQAVASVVRHVFGMDIHPVAVALARVTYLLAIGTSRLKAHDRAAITIPVFLGDSVQWEQRRDLFDTHGTVTVHTDDHELVEGGGGTMFEDDLVFPITIIEDAPRFDTLVREMAEKAFDMSATYDRTLVDPVLDRAGVTDVEQRKMLTATFSTMRGLHRTGNDHVWSYYVRNLVRPLWLSTVGNRVDVLVGNPPWLRYSDMTAPMQARYLNLCRERGLLSGPIGASSRDLSTLFVARAVELYLRNQGRFAFVMPHGIMTRKPHDGFRSGRWVHATSAFETAWDLGPSSKATGFPMPACVIRGFKAPAARLSPDVDRWTVRARRSDLPWSQVAASTTRAGATLYVLSSTDPEPESPYRSKFRAGAIIYPRVLLFVTERDAGPMGAGAGRVTVTSRRSDKAPWRAVEPLDGVVESDFVHPVHLGETVLPFRTLEPARAVIPIDPGDPDSMLSLPGTQAYPALAAWWARVEAIWQLHRKPSETADLIDRVDYSSQLSSQFPAGKHEHRVVYTASGNSLAAARLEGDASLIEHKLYWGPVASANEGRYLVGIINSRAMQEAVTPMQSLGLFGTRDFDKLVFRVPFAAYDPTDSSHTALVAIVQRAEGVAEDTDLSTASTFHQARALIRAELAAVGLGDELEAAVEAVLPVVSL